MNRNKSIHWFIISTFVILWLFVSLISMIHVIEFFELSNPRSLAITLAIAFEVGGAASLASIIVLDRMNKTIVWSIFILLALVMMMGNTYYAFVHLENYTGWIELFGLQGESVIMQKRILSIISGALLPLIALGFIKALVDYLRPSEDKTEETPKVEKTEETPKVEKTEETPKVEKTEETPKVEKKQETEIIKDNEKFSVDSIKDPKLKQDINEYINKTKSGKRHPNMKTTPGIG